MEWVKIFWRENGTKLLGLSTTVLAAIYFAADDIMNLVSDKYRPFLKLTFAILGYFIVKRGIGNSTR